MLISEFLEYMKKPTDYRDRTYTEDEIREMSDDLETFRYAKELQKLFIQEKAIHDPSDNVKELQERMRELGAKESFIREMSTILQYFEFDCHISLQEGIRQSFRSKARQMAKPIEKRHEYSIEYWYDIEIA